MKAIWERIHAWFEANAPAGYGDLRPGASADEIRVAEELMGLKLPDDLVASYRIHDGQGNGSGLVGGEGWWLLPIQRMVRLWGRWSRADPRDAYFVPLAWIGTGDYVFLNLDPDFRKLDPDAEEPGYLMIQRRDSTDPDPFVLSIFFWLEDFADELECGVFAYSEELGAVMYLDEIAIHLQRHSQGSNEAEPHGPAESGRVPVFS